MGKHHLARHDIIRSVMSLYWSTGLAKRKKRKASRKKTQNRWRRLFWKSTLWLFVLGLLGLATLDVMVRVKFEGKKWALPAHVYARSLDLYEGLRIKPKELSWELDALGYRAVSRVAEPGQYRRRNNTIELYTRGFRFWDGEEPARRYTVSFDGNLLYYLGSGDDSPSVVRLEPLRMGGIFPEHLEDRELVRLDELPPWLLEGLLAMEDRNFYQHYGVSFRGIARAMLANLRAGGMNQGGSTITQQLVKNFYLTQDRKLWRKIVEIPMAMLLELHYSKGEILETYINEVFLGQAGKRAIHGFALASRHYFQQPLQELDLHQVALLIAVVKGASYYDPWRHPQRARQRRDLVLAAMQENNIIDAKTVARYRNKGLGVVARRSLALNNYPAYLDLVKRQLRDDYSSTDLNSEGLRIFTSFDPQIQRRLEHSISSRLDNLEQGYRIEKGQLQAGAVVTSVGSGEVVAVAGGREPQFAGFNRALDAQRTVGSTLKPAVYLAALESQGYTLASILKDEPLTVDMAGGQRWRPRNFGRESHGDVPLYKALGYSYNLSTARLGMDIGIPAVADAVNRLGFERNVPELPSLSLGAVGMSPFDVSGMYHTIAADGFYTPLRAIRAIYDANNQPLKRYRHEVEQRFDPEAIHLLQYALQVVVREGTGKNVYKKLPSDLVVAGKTGTSNDQRDSWFAGFSGNYLSVVWLGRDDNGKMPLTGGTGALRVWADLMAGIDNEPLAFVRPERVSYVWVDSQGYLSGERCEGARYLPFIEGTAPQIEGQCYQRPQRSVVDWFKELLKKR